MDTCDIYPNNYDYYRFHTLIHIYAMLYTLFLVAFSNSAQLIFHEVTCSSFSPVSSYEHMIRVHPLTRTVMFPHVDH